MRCERKSYLPISHLRYEKSYGPGSLSPTPRARLHTTELTAPFRCRLVTRNVLIRHTGRRPGDGIAVKTSVQFWLLIGLSHLGARELDPAMIVAAPEGPDVDLVAFYNHYQGPSSEQIDAGSLQDIA